MDQESNGSSCVVVDIENLLRGLCMLPPKIASELQEVFSQLSTERKVEIVRLLSAESLHVLHAGLSEAVDTLLRLEFESEPSPKLRCIRNFLTQFAKNSVGALSESAFLRDFLYVAAPALYVTELELHTENEPPLSESDFLDFISIAFASILYGIPSTRRIRLKTSELKRYSKTRLNLDADDCLELHTPDGPFRATQACIFNVNRLSVLCGFFAKNGTWRSEKYADDEALSRILEKYNLVCRRL